jgi:hypothetical protein
MNDRTPDWSAMHDNEIRIGIEHGLTPDAAARAADDVIAYRQDTAGRTFGMAMALDDPIAPGNLTTIDTPDGDLLAVDTGRWERGTYTTDDTGRMTRWMPTND